MKKEEAEKLIREEIAKAKPCPFCGSIPKWSYRTDETRSSSGSMGHYAVRESCCKVVGRDVDLFFCNDNAPADYELWYKMIYWQVFYWNDRKLLELLVDKKFMPILYYTPPTDEIFNEVKNASMELWKEVDTDNDKYGYATKKINRIKDIANVSDNFMYIVAMFDIQNQARLAEKLSEETRKEVRERMIDGGNPPEYIRF
jgi:hypothetical protein